MINREEEIQDPKNLDLRPYRKFGITLLQLMLLLAVTGLVGTLVLHYLFN